MSVFSRPFGTARGLVRLLLSYAQVLAIPRADPSKARRLVFVCSGNICRSAFADALARQLGARAASFGLRTTGGMRAHPPVALSAWRRRVDLGSHLTQTVGAFVPEPDDLYLVMEVRQIGMLREDPRFAHASIDLLGRYAGFPHIHDPFELDASYVETSLDRIDRAVRKLVRKSVSARADG